MKSPRTVVARRRVPNIVEAMDSPELFGPGFRGESWDSWRATWKAAHALPMTLAEVAFFKSISGNREPPQRRVREFWCAIGRGGGKDSTASLAAGHAAASFDPSVLRPGERALVACFAVDKDQAKILFRYVKSYFDTIPRLAKMVDRVAESDGVIELRNSVDICIMTGSFRSVRGRPILLAVLDEVAFLRDESSSAPDIELYRALLPAMRLPQSMLIGISSPYRKAGLLYERYRKHFGQNSDDVLVVQAASHVMNPTLDVSDRDRMMLEDPAAARAEYYAEFRDDLVAFIDPATVDRAVVAGRIELPPVPGVAYTAAVDPSGGSSDSMTLAIAHAEGERGVLDLVREWPAPFSPEQVVTEIVAICRSYGAASVVGDRYAGEFAREPFRIRGVDYQIAAYSRSEAYLGLLPAINTPGRIELLDNRRLISQLCALERRVARSGRDTVDHPRGGHDDIINSAALALVGAALTPKSSADNWLEFMRRQAVRAGLEVDDVRASGPNFGFEFGPGKVPEQLIKLTVPVPIATGGGNGVTVYGERFTYRFEGNSAVISVPHDHARNLLSFDHWRNENPVAAREVLGEGSKP